jgi:hypothetical protein
MHAAMAVTGTETPRRLAIQAAAASRKAGDPIDGG